MSSQLCPDCGTPLLEGELRAATCKLCGWTGDASGFARKIMEFDSESDAETFRLLDLRRAGRLHALRVHFDGKPVFAVESAIKDLLQNAPTSCRGNILLLLLERRPSEEALSRLRAMSGVRTVDLR